ncbi:hypothetical protein WG66_012732 [Moniliophthora roreri]|nr:hypothetical protein WG66_012732 [Moniliophthora roreri]
MSRLRSCGEQVVIVVWNQDAIFSHEIAEIDSRTGSEFDLTTMTLNLNLGYNGNKGAER